ncbi:MAG: hypothetical protein KA769_08575 [Piscinibacter sp.]|uniref:hypothetical protein n=1 Tax=Piscinibacter sp. TaxID=1903157 RepID=UPI001B7387A5|nr:hypothetical protein [Piscinibacter sp.]MBP6027389.1 hypothetical protein [Piscinibacter sp.]
MNHHYSRISLLAVLLALAGCAAPPVAPVQTAETPFALVKRRFHTEAQTPVLDGVENAVKGYARFIDGIQGRKAAEPPDYRRPLLDERLSLVIWTAYYTDVNFGQLTMPSAALRRHCADRAGQWRVVEALSADPLAAQRADPAASWMDAYQRVGRHLAAQQAYAGFEEMRGVVAQDVARQMAASAVLINQRNDRLFSVQGYRMAQRLEAFGLFECREAAGTTWRAAVLPVLLLARDPNSQIDSSAARLAIQVLEPKGATL